MDSPITTAPFTRSSIGPLKSLVASLVNDLKRQIIAHLQLTKLKFHKTTRYPKFQTLLEHAQRTSWRREQLANRWGCS